MEKHNNMDDFQKHYVERKKLDTARKKLECLLYHPIYKQQKQAKLIYSD